MRSTRVKGGASWVMKGEFGRGLVTFGWKLGEELKGQTLNKYFQFYKM